MSEEKPETMPRCPKCKGGLMRPKPTGGYVCKTCGAILKTASP